MNIFVLFLFLLKAVATSFSGFASIPILRADLVLHHHVLTDQQLNTAIVVSRATPGPVALYVVSVGYMVAGTPGAIAGWLAMTLPALIIIPLLLFAGRFVTHPRVRSMLQAIILSSGGLMWVAAMELAHGTVNDAVTVAICVVTVLLLCTRKVDSIWVILGAAAAELGAASVHLVAGL